MAGVPVMWRFPETKGLTLEEVGVLFGDNVTATLASTTDDDEEESKLGGGGGQVEMKSHAVTLENVED